VLYPYNAEHVISAWCEPAIHSHTSLQWLPFTHSKVLSLLMSPLTPNALGQWYEWYTTSIWVQTDITTFLYSFCPQMTITHSESSETNQPTTETYVIDQYYCITVYIFIFVGVNFCGFRVIRENYIFVNPRKFFTLWIHENFSCSVAALLAQQSISFKVPPYSLPRDDGAIKICTIFYLSSLKQQKYRNFSFSLCN